MTHVFPLLVGIVVYVIMMNAFVTAESKDMRLKPPKPDWVIMLRCIEYSIVSTVTGMVFMLFVNESLKKG